MPHLHLFFRESLKKPSLASVVLVWHYAGTITSFSLHFIFFKWLQDALLRCFLSPPCQDQILFSIEREKYLRSLIGPRFIRRLLEFRRRVILVRNSISPTFNYWNVSLCPIYSSSSKLNDCSSEWKMREGVVFGTQPFVWNVTKFVKKSEGEMNVKFQAVKAAERNPSE